MVTCNYCQKNYAALVESRLIEHREACSANLAHVNPLQNHSTPVASSTSSTSSNSEVNVGSKIEKETKQSSLDGYVEQLFMSEQEIENAQLALARFFFACNISFLSVL